MNHDHISAHDRRYRRAGHVSWCCGHVMMVWGGVVEHRYRSPPGPNKTPTCGNSFHDPTIVLSYDPMSHQWSELRCSGDVPPPTVAPAGVWSSHDNLLYIFGGMVDSPYLPSHSSNQLYSLDVVSRHWTRLTPSGPCPPSLEKCSGWEHDGDIYIFGGYSDDRTLESCDQFETAVDNHSGVEGVWTNCLLRYNVRTNQISFLTTRGVTPEPRAGAGVCRAGGRVFVFGGKTQYGRLNDLHSLDLKTMTWSLLEDDTDPYLLGWGPPSPTHPSPRSLHSMVSVPGDKRLMVYGGIDQLNGLTNDLWVLHYTDHDHWWEELELRYDHGEVRCWHSAVITHTAEMILHSGLTQEYYLTRMDLDNHSEDLLHFNFGLPSLTRLAFEAVVKQMEATDHHHSLSILPRSLYSAVQSRLSLTNHCRPDKYSPIDTEYLRSRLHVGV